MIAVVLILLIVIAIQRMEIAALSLYIKDNGFSPDTKTIRKYSEMAAKKFFHIPN